MANQKLQCNIGGRNFTIKYKGDWVLSEQMLEEKCKEHMIKCILSNSIPRNEFVTIRTQKMNEKNIIAGGALIIDDSLFVIQEVSSELCVIECQDVESKHYLLKRKVPTIYLIMLKSN